METFDEYGQRMISENKISSMQKYMQMKNNLLEYSKEMGYDIQFETLTNEFRNNFTKKNTAKIYNPSEREVGAREGSVSWTPDWGNKYAIEKDKDSAGREMRFYKEKGLDGKEHYYVDWQIDFNKNFAIAYILPQTNRKTDLAPLSLTLKKKHLELQYKLEQGKAQTYFTQPFFIIVVDKKYASEKILKAAEQKPIMLMQDDPLFMEDE